ncbi:hypothetical protein BGZ52_012880, partial [Haplosporangium bisporale]
CASQNMLDHVELPDKKKLRAKAKELTTKAFISFKVEQQIKATQNNNSGEEESREASDQSSNYTNQFFNLQAMFAVEAYDLQVTADPQKYTRFMEAPQDYWRMHQENPEVKDLAQVARSFLSIQATSTESERLFSKAGRVLTARKTRMTDHNFCNIIFASSYEKILP